MPLAARGRTFLRMLFEGARRYPIKSIITAWGEEMAYAVTKIGRKPETRLYLYPDICHKKNNDSTMIIAIHTVAIKRLSLVTEHYVVDELICNGTQKYL